uniref:Transmembrane protein 270 n=1 Tax=Oryctolagus cuniculus TaxID=9986 RepID=G1SN93_RABIT
MRLGKQWKMAQVLGFLHPLGRLRRSSWLLAPPTCWGDRELCSVCSQAVPQFPKSHILSSSLEISQEPPWNQPLDLSPGSLCGKLNLKKSLLQELVQNRAHLYKFLLIKITLFNDWVSGLAQEARGDSGRQPRPPPGVLACPLGRVLMWVPMWLLLWGPRLAWAAVLGCVRTLGLSLQRLGLSVATWGDLLLSCLHSLMLVALLLVLLTWRLFQKAHRCSLGWLPGQVLLGNHAVLELLRRLSWWVESTTALASWHLAYLVTWTTCLASHLLQAAFEHTAQLARAQETQPLQAPEPLSEPPLPKASTPEAGPVLPEPGPPGE